MGRFVANGFLLSSVLEADIVTVRQDLGCILIVVVHAHIRTHARTLHINLNQSL